MFKNIAVITYSDFLAGSCNAEQRIGTVGDDFLTYAFALSAIRSASIPISRSCPVGEVIWPQK
jgi:hypothetical protein